MTKYGPKAQSSVKKEMRHRKKGKHGKMTKKQAIGIGLSKARRKGAKVPKRKGRSRRTKKGGRRKK